MLPVHSNVGTIHDNAVFPIQIPDKFFRDWKSAARWGTSKGLTTAFPLGRRIATMLLCLETSIPTAYKFINKSFLLRECNWSGPDLLIAHSIYRGVTRTHSEGSPTCIKRTLRMKIWLAVCLTGAKSREVTAIPIARTFYQLKQKMGNSLLAVGGIIRNIL